jgi:hypothetical protein
MFLLNQIVSTPLLVKQKELIEVVEADDLNEVVVDADGESVTLLWKQMMLILCCGNIQGRLKLLLLQVGS